MIPFAWWIISAIYFFLAFIELKYFREIKELKSK